MKKSERYSYAAWKQFGLMIDRIPGLFIRAMTRKYPFIIREAKNSPNDNAPTFKFLVILFDDNSQISMTGKLNPDTGAFTFKNMRHHPQPERDEY